MKPLEITGETRPRFFPSQGCSNQAPAECHQPFNVQRRARRKAQAARVAERGTARTRQKREMKQRIADDLEGAP